MAASINPNVCSICLNEFPPDFDPGKLKPGYILPQGYVEFPHAAAGANGAHIDNTVHHIFCEGCLAKWAAQKNTCPLCRRVRYENHPAAAAVPPPPPHAALFGDDDEIFFGGWIPGHGGHPAAMAAAAPIPHPQVPLMAAAAPIPHPQVPLMAGAVKAQFEADRVIMRSMGLDPNQVQWENADQMHRDLSLLKAVHFGNRDAINPILQQGPISNRVLAKAVLSASRTGQRLIVERLLQNAEPIAAQDRDEAYLLANESNRKDIIELLKQNGPISLGTRIQGAWFTFSSFSWLV